MNINIRHAGIFKFKTNVTDQEKQAFFTALKNLEQLEGVQKMEISKQISTKNAFEYGFSMEFANDDVYEAYNIHPQHDAFVKNYWLKYVEDFMEIDTVQMNIL
ncbi:MAG: Dabb family protein [Saprospiraceae bacterium]|nr:Dabb family protein [Saprospiraceae bacterium]